LIAGVVKSVAIKPGQTALTRMFFPFKFHADDWTTLITLLQNKKESN
jgi:hypothetical protein